MSQNYTHTLVYQRKKHRRNSVAVCATQASGDTKPNGCCHSAVNSEAPSVHAQEHMVSASELAPEAVRLQIVLPVEFNTGAAESFSRHPVGKEASYEEALRNNLQRGLNLCWVNDNYSSSKSNLDHLKTDVGDQGECSSSGTSIARKFSDDMSERDICISILRSQGLLEKGWTRQNHASDKDTGIANDNCCSKTCKVCEQVETTLNMLICDICEESFHMSCCNPRMKRIPVGEWLCNTCLKKKHKLLKDKSTSNSMNISTEIGQNGNSASEGALGPIEYMLRATEPYMSDIRIGNEFQADVPDWSGPVDNESDLIGEPLELDLSKNASMQAWNATKPLKLSSIGNWLQCRELIEGIGDVDGTICGKWRRAPLFEVQTDDWECFCCVLWDPAHADCSVPQELDTEEVMKQLKYIEMLRPRLAAKRRKLDSRKSMVHKNSDFGEKNTELWRPYSYVYNL
ncbi:transcription intermediary factor 1-alpha [Forsythia ovata]|uniref:Transcription intermediary factor 1-alpha n=1 Tax=Forsythia ovata TaxID=205694 RepID=A0ABD1WWM7_9LAMI